MISAWCRLGVPRVSDYPKRRGYTPNKLPKANKLKHFHLAGKRVNRRHGAGTSNFDFYFYTSIFAKINFKLCCHYSLISEDAKEKKNAVAFYARIGGIVYIFKISPSCNSTKTKKRLGFSETTKLV